VNKAKNQQTAAQEREERIFAIVLQIWDEYNKKLLSYGEDARKPLEMFVKLYGVDEQSPIALMFQSFVGGLFMGLTRGGKRNKGGLWHE